MNACEPVPDPVGDDDFRFGYWAGVGDASAWHEGCAAARAGVLVCPYRVGADDECFREPWLDGYGGCLRGLESARIAGHG